MIHNRFKDKPNNDRAQDKLVANRNNRQFGQFEQLEEKRCLAFLGFFNGVTLMIDQTADDGDVLIENSTGVWRATDNAATWTFVAAQNIEVNMLDNTANRLDLAVDEVHTGDVTANLGEGVRDMFFEGVLNEIGGDLEVNAGAGTQLITLSGDAAADLFVSGSVDINLGEGADIVWGNGSATTVEGNHFNMTGVNFTSDPATLPIETLSLTVGLPGPPPIPGNINIDNSGEDQSSIIVIGGTAAGDVTYTGNVNIDRFDLTTTSVSGNVNVDLDVGNPFFGDSQLINIAGQVEGDVNMTAGDANLGNDIDLTGSFLGNIVSYVGGNLVDDIQYEFTGTQADVFVTMNGGDDRFDLNLPVNLLEIDFGNDLGDVFSNNLAEPIDFEFDITNFQFFNFFYTALNDTLVMNQLIDTGDIVINNAGKGLPPAPDPGFDWQLFTGLGGVASTTRAENLILTMVPNTGNEVEMDLINPVIASIDMTLGDGARLVEFTGIANNPLRDITITAGAGDQHVDLSVNNPLGVASLEIDLGTGMDTVTDNANNLTINEDLLFTGVNNFQNDGILVVTRDFLFDTSGETQDSVFANNGTMIVGSTFTYTGGDGADEVRLNGAGGTTINQTALIDLGDSVIGNPQTAAVNSANTTFEKTLTVTSANSTGVDIFVADPGTTFNGNLSVSLGDGINDAFMAGVFGGTNVSYTGGGGQDFVDYSLTGNPATLTILLGGDDDELSLKAGSSIGGPLFVDFGNNNDTFVNDFGTFNFDAMLIGLQSFSYTYTAATDSLTAVQVSNNGNAEFDNNGPANAFRYNNGVTDITPASNFTVAMLDGTGNLEIALDSPLAGNLTANLGNGNRNLSLSGLSNSMGGDLVVTAGSGEQSVTLSGSPNLAVGGNAWLNLGVDHDILDENSINITTTGNLSLIGVNSFRNNGTVTVGGDLSVDNSADSVVSLFDDDASLVITGSFTYLGSSAADTVALDGAAGGSSIGGNAVVELGTNTSTLVGQMAWFNAATTSVGGNLTVTSTAAQGTDTYLSNAAASFGGNIDINLGDGANNADIVGVLGGSAVTYTGGSGVDIVTFGTTGSLADVDIDLGDNDDTFSLLAGAAIQPDTLTVDFGPGLDTFNNLYGPFDFNANLLNLDGFNHIYNFATDTLVSSPLSDPGNLTIDNNGPGGAIRFINGGTNVITPVNNLTVNLLDGNSDLDVNLDGSGLAGDLTLNVGNGNRSLYFGGTSNTIGGDLTVTAGSGGQTVEVAVNAHLGVGGHASFDLGTGLDVVDENSNNIDVSGDLTLTGVNQFETSGLTSVGGNVAVDTTGETESSLFDDDEKLVVTGDFTYTGGLGDDGVYLNGFSGTEIGGNVTIHLGGNVLGGEQDAYLNGPGSVFGGNVMVTSTDASHTDTYLTASSVTISGNIDIDLGGGTNFANILGAVVAGTSVTYGGGSGTDTVSFGTTGNPVDVDVNLGAGNDDFNLLAGASIQPTTLTVDFGGGVDTFDNQYGNFDFNANLINLIGFDYIYTHATQSLVASQVGPSGPVQIDNNGSNQAIRFTNDGSTSEFTPVNDLTVNMLNGSGTSLNLTLDSLFSGDMSFSLGSGTRSMTFDGSDNSIDGLLTITAGTGDQTVNLALNQMLSVTAETSINLGTGSDTAGDQGNGLDFGSDLVLQGINDFTSNGLVSVAGNMLVSNVGDSANTTYDINRMSVAGELNYQGGSGRDELTLDSGNPVTVGGNAGIHLDANSTSGTQLVALSDGVRISGTLDVTSSSASNPDSFWSTPGAQFDDDILINLGGGTNHVVLRGVFGGTAVKYNGGTSTDNFTYGLTGNPTNPNIKLNTGNDAFVLDAGVSIDTFLRVDFGGGIDSITNNFGNFTFDAKLLRLNGFDRFYDLATDSLNMEQSSDTGNVTLDNNGPGSAIRLITTGATSMTAADNVRLILMDNTSSNVTVDYDTALAGDTILQLRNGTRTVEFTGNSNQFGGLLRIEAADGVQDIHLGVNADLTVGGNLRINTRDGYDVIDDGIGNIVVGNAVILRGVNEFINTNNFTAAGDMNWVGVLESADFKLVNNGNFFVGGFLTYLGGSGVDEVLFNNGTTNIGATAYFNLGTSDNPLKEQRVRMVSNFFAADVLVIGGQSAGGNTVITDVSTEIANNLIINFQGTTNLNTALLFGDYGGDYSTYLGGNGDDYLTMGINDAPTTYFVAFMNNGNDVFELEAGTELAKLLADGGSGDNTLIDNLGPSYPFPVHFENF